MSFPGLSNIPQAGQKRESTLDLKSISVENPESATGGKKNVPLKTSWLSKERIRLSLDYSIILNMKDTIERGIGDDGLYLFAQWQNRCIVVHFLVCFFFISSDLLAGRL